MPPSSSSRKRLIAWDVRMIEHTGIGTYLRGVLPHLVALRHECGIDFVFIGPRDKLEKYQFLRVGGRIVDYRIPIYSLREQLLFPRLSDVDAYHFPHYNVPVTLRRPFFVTIHDIIPLVRPEYRTQRFYGTAVRLLVGHGVRYARKIFVPSLWVREELVRQFSLSNDKIEVTPYAPPHDFAIPDRQTIDAVMRRFRLTQPYILCISLHKPHKNLLFLLKVFSLLTEAHSNFGRRVKLVLAGLRPKDVAALTAAISHLLGRDKRDRIVLITDYLSSAELAALYVGALALVTPSLLEGFGLPIVEAQKLGIPVCAPDLPWAHDTAGQGALFFSPHQPESLVNLLKQLESDKNLRETLTKHGHANLARYDWQETARRLMNAYINVL